MKKNNCVARRKIYHCRRIHNSISARNVQVRNSCEIFLAQNFIGKTIGIIFKVLGLIAIIMMFVFLMWAIYSLLDDVRRIQVCWTEFVLERIWAELRQSANKHNAILHSFLWELFLSFFSPSFLSVFIMPNVNCSCTCKTMLFYDIICWSMNISFIFAS